MTNILSKNPDDIISEVFDDIASNAMYLRSGEDDKNRYYLGPEALEALSFLIFQISIPILTGMASTLVLEWVKRHRENKSIEVKHEIDSVPADKISNAKKEVKALLMERGWPEEQAENDSEKTISAIVEQLSE